MVQVDVCMYVFREFPTYPTCQREIYIDCAEHKILIISDADFEKKIEYSMSNIRSNRIIRKSNIRNRRKIFEVNRIFDSIFFLFQQ
jgi:hypothetical protein